MYVYGMYYQGLLSLSSGTLTSNPSYPPQIIPHEYLTAIQRHRSVCNLPVSNLCVSVYVCPHFNS